MHRKLIFSGLFIALMVLTACSQNPGGNNSSSSSGSSSPSAVTIIGPWTLNYYFPSVPSSGTTTITFSNDNTFGQHDGNTGTWSTNGTSFIGTSVNINISTGPVWSGAIQGTNYITGTMTLPFAGTWEAIRD